MKVYILQVPSELQPVSQALIYPSHNKDYGVEQDFLIWLNNNPQLLANNPKEADWHYLPIFWTRWHINHNFAANNQGIDELENYVSQIILNKQRTFTVTQFDGGTLLSNESILEFTAARITNQGIDIPILCSKHKQSLFPVRKKYIATFNGSFHTHSIRNDIRNIFLTNNDVLIGNSLPTRFLKRMIQGKQFNLNTLASYIALCPRGTSCNSFRFFEAMQLGVAPCLIGDQDVRPFKKFIDWDKMSYYAKTVAELESLINNVDKKDALKKGKLAKHFFHEELYYQKWCKYIIKELNG